MNNSRAASVHQRLLNIAHRESRRFKDLLQHYALERWLFRLSRSSHNEQLILKGALFLTVWQSPIRRPTRDIDLRVTIRKGVPCGRKQVTAQRKSSFSLLPEARFRGEATRLRGGPIENSFAAGAHPK